MKIIALFVSHRCGEHTITLHNSINSAIGELSELMKMIHENGEYSQDQKGSDKNALAHLESYHEFVDSTWYHYQEIEVSFKIRNNGTNHR